MVTVAVVEHEILTRAGVCSILNGSGTISVVGDGVRALEVVRRVRPDVVVVEIRLSGLDGIRLTRIIAMEMSATKVVVFTDAVAGEWIHRLLRAGASGFLAKTVDPAELVSAVRSVHAGHHRFSPEVTCHIVDQFKRINRDQTRLARDKIGLLTRREREVTALVAAVQRGSGLLRASTAAEAGVLADQVGHLGQLAVLLATGLAVGEVRRDVRQLGGIEAALHERPQQCHLAMGRFPNHGVGPFGSRHAHCSERYGAVRRRASPTVSQRRPPNPPLEADHAAGNTPAVP